MSRNLLLLDLREALGALRCAGKGEDELFELAIEELRRLRDQDDALRRARRVMRQFWSHDEIDDLYRGHTPDPEDE